MEYNPFPPFQLALWYSIIGLSMCWILYRYKNNRLAILIILLFFNGFFGYLGKDIQNIYKIVTLVIAIDLTIKYNAFKSITIKLNRIFFLFILFLFFFLVSSFYINSDSVFIAFSQLNRFVIPVLVFFIFEKERSKILQFSIY